MTYSTVHYVNLDKIDSSISKSAYHTVMNSSQDITKIDHHCEGIIKNVDKQFMLQMKQLQNTELDDLGERLTSIITTLCCNVLILHISYRTMYVYITVNRVGKEFVYLDYRQALEKLREEFKADSASLAQSEVLCPTISQQLHIAQLLLA
jgi:hypothetical protein